MAQIKISGVDGSITISNDIAARLAADKQTLTIPEQREKWVQIGQWQGYLSKVHSVLIEKEIEYNKKCFDRPLTPEERKSYGEMMKRARTKLEEKGIIKKK